MASVVLLVTGPEPVLLLASFSASTEKLASAVVIPPMVIAICIHDRKVLSLAASSIVKSVLQGDVKDLRTSTSCALCCER